MTETQKEVAPVQNRIEYEDGSLFCKWHTEGEETILDGVHGSLSFEGMMKQLRNPKPDKTGRCGRRKKR